MLAGEAIRNSSTKFCSCCAADTVGALDTGEAQEDAPSRSEVMPDDGQVRRSALTAKTVQSWSAASREPKAYQTQGSSGLNVQRADVPGPPRLVSPRQHVIEAVAAAVAATDAAKVAAAEVSAAGPSSPTASQAAKERYSSLWYGDPDPPLSRKERYKNWMQRRRQTCRKVLHSVPVQAMITVAVIIDLAVSFESLLVESTTNSDFRHSGLGVTIIWILALEILCRLFVEGLQFVFRFVNVFEGVIMFLAVVMLYVGDLFENQPVGVGRAVRPTAKALRGFRVALKLYTRGNHLKESASQAIETKVREVFGRTFDNIVRVRPENFTIAPRKGQFHLHKARLVTEMHGLHLPLHLIGGFVENLDITVPVPRMKVTSGKIRLDGDMPVIGRADSGSTANESILSRTLTWWRRCSCRRRREESDTGDGNRATKVRIEVNNALLVIGPGSAVDWHDIETLMQSKDRLVKLILRPLLATGLSTFQLSSLKPGAGAQMATEMGVSNLLEPIRKKLGEIFKLGQRGLVDLLRSKIMQGAEIVVSNIVIQYEDPGDGPKGVRPSSLGCKLGCLRIITTDLSQTMETSAVEMGSTLSRVTANTSSRASSEASSPKLRHFSINDALQNLTLVVNLERLSTWCSVGPTPGFLYASMLQELKLEKALRQLKSADRLERLKLALASRGGELGEKVDHEVVRRRMYRKDIFQQFPYVLQPVWALATFPLPGLLTALTSLGLKEKPTARELKVTSGPVVVTLDSEQVKIANHLLEYYVKWVRKDWSLRQRPDVSISTVKEMHSSDEHSRRTVVRQWWFHAFVLAQEHSGTKTRHVASIIELQNAAGRRLEFIRLQSRLMMAPQMETSRMRRVRKAVRQLFRRKARHVADTSIQVRIRELQVRMSLLEILRSFLEARMLVEAMEVAREAGDDKSMARLTVTTEDGGSFGIHSNSLEVGHMASQERREKFRAVKLQAAKRMKALRALRHKHSLDRKARSMASSSSIITKAMEESQLKMDGLGLNPMEFIPTACSIAVCMAEMVLFSVARQHGDSYSRPPYVHPRGTRHMLFRLWAIDTRCTLTIGQLTEAKEARVVTDVEVTVMDAAGSYCTPHTGIESKAVSFRSCHDGERSFAVQGVFRRKDRPWLISTASDSSDIPHEWAVDDRASIPRSPSDSNPGMLSDFDMLRTRERREAVLKAPLWVGNFVVNPVTIVVNTAPIMSISEVFAGALVETMTQRLISWLLAETYRPLMKQRKEDPNEPHSWKMELAARRRELHIRQRLAEIMFGLSVAFQVDLCLEVDFRGADVTLIQPQWDPCRWTDWLQGVRRAGGIPGPYHVSGLPARTVEAALSIPAMPNLIVRRRRHPPEVSVEIVMEKIFPSLPVEPNLAQAVPLTPRPQLSERVRDTGSSSTDALRESKEKPIQLRPSRPVRSPRLIEAQLMGRSARKVLSAPAPPWAATIPEPPMLRPKQGPVMGTLNFQSVIRAYPHQGRGPASPEDRRLPPVSV